MKKTMSATKARQQFFKIIKQAQQPGSTLTLTVDGEAKVIIMPVEDYEGWMETLEIMQDTALMKGIAKALKEKKVFTEKEVKKKLGLS